MAICVGVLLSIALCVVALACCLFKRYVQQWNLTCTIVSLNVTLCNIVTDYEIEY